MEKERRLLDCVHSYLPTFKTNMKGINLSICFGYRANGTITPCNGQSDPSLEQCFPEQDQQRSGL